MIFQCGPPGPGEMMSLDPYQPNLPDEQWRRQQQQDQEQANRYVMEQAQRDRALRQQQSYTHHQFPDTRGGGGLLTREQQIQGYKAVAMDPTNADDVRQRAAEQQTDLLKKEFAMEERKEKQRQNKLKHKPRSKGRRCINITRIANAVQCHS